MIDNKVRIYIYTPKGKGIAKLNVLTIQDPRLFPYVFEQQVTSSLGYTPVRRLMNENKVNSQEGLIRHLGNMELVSLYRKSQGPKALNLEYASALVSLERTYIEHINLMGDNLKEINNSMERIIKKTEPLLNPTNDPKKNEESLYKRFLHKIGF